VNGLTLDTLADVRVTITVMLGRATAAIAEVLSYAPGTVVPLEISADAPAPLFVNGVAVATGDIVTTEDGYLAMQIRELLPDTRLPR
jgi:flagellar motor switch/type III secretory pathway protein FliN